MSRGAPAVVSRRWHAPLPRCIGRPAATHAGTPHPVAGAGAPTFRLRSSWGRVASTIASSCKRIHRVAARHIVATMLVLRGARVQGAWSRAADTCIADDPRDPQRARDARRRRRGVSRAMHVLRESSRVRRAVPRCSRESRRQCHRAMTTPEILSARPGPPTSSASRRRRARHRAARRTPLARRACAVARRSAQRGGSGSARAFRLAGRAGSGTHRFRTARARPLRAPMAGAGSLTSSGRIGELACKGPAAIAP